DDARGLQARGRGQGSLGARQGVRVQAQRRQERLQGHGREPLMSALVVQGIEVPALMYGTAWKEDDTARCVADAIAAGFRAIDTANQRKHYHEAGVGAGIAQAGVERDALFLQTKFTYRRGQDHRLPYEPQADLATQVEQSFASSLEH